jgi:hypothetical protein
MGKLDGQRHATDLARRVDHALQRRFVGVVPQAQAARRDASFRLDAGGLDDQQAGARQRQLAVVHQVPVVGIALLGRVLAHRRDDNAVGQRDAADGEWGKQ